MLLEWCEKKILLAGAGAEQQNRVIDVSVIVAPKLETLGCLTDEPGSSRFVFGTTVLQVATAF